MFLIVNEKTLAINLKNVEYFEYGPDDTTIARFTSGEQYAIETPFEAFLKVLPRITDWDEVS